jgi:hypothetical protein
VAPACYALGGSYVEDLIIRLSLHVPQQMTGKEADLRAMPPMLFTPRHTSLKNWRERWPSATGLTS